jgi:pimeloyl-ACP methyl ester carboxylesterase
MLADAIRENSNQKTTDADPKVTMFCHDWGATVTFIFVKKYPQFVKRIISLDVGGNIKLTKGFMLVVLSY